MKQNHKGDTIVEVLLAMAVLSTVLFGSWAIINKATQISAAARQRVVMVNQLKEQAEILKNMYATDASAVTDRTLHSTSSPAITVPSISTADASLTVNPCDATYNGVVNGKSPANAFYLDQVNNVIQPVISAKKLQTYPNAKVWIQLNDTSGTYMDFYIRACWETSDRQGQDSSQIVVRFNK